VDRTFWQNVVANDCKLPDGYTISDLTPELTCYLGVTDPVERDEIGYSVLSRWIINGLYTPDDMRYLIRQMCINLQAGLGESGTDSVFLRSFSVLILAAIMYYDNHKQPFLSREEVRELLNKSLDYMSHETDTRGYVPEKGWAHSCAHTADLLDELAINRCTEAGELEHILTTIANKVMMPTGYVYQHDEDERLSVAVISALRRDMIPSVFLSGWLANIAGLPERLPRATRMTNAGPHSAYLNTKNFLRSVYTRLGLTEDLPESARALQPDVLAALKPFGFAYD
jgi:hypothetical protein